ncbi:MAG: PAS domain-containing protein, partial [Burkholderiaceae bacterium]
MNKNRRSVGALDLYLAPVDSEKLQLHRTLMATGTALGVLLLVAGMYAVGMLALGGLLVAVALILFGNLISYLMLATGLNKKLRDPSMTKGQNLAASVTMIVVAYMATPTGHNLALMTLPAIFVYSSFRFGFAALLKLASIVMILAVVETLLRFDFGAREGFDQALVTLIALAVTLVTLSMVGGQFNDMRRRNRAQRAVSHVAMTQLTEAVVTVNRHGVVRFINQGARTLFLCDDEADGLAIDSLCAFTSQQPLSSVLSELAERIDLFAGEDQHKLDQREMLGGSIELPTGDYRFIRLSVSPLLRQSGEVDGFVLVVRDVSDTQRLMKELEHAAT